MARELTKQELDDLLGVYALDAVDGEERDQVEEYLDRDPTARARVESTAKRPPCCHSRAPRRRSISGTASRRRSTTARREAS